VSVDAVIANVARRLNRQFLASTTPSGPVALPPPDPDATYLLYLHIPFCRSLCPFCSFHRVRFSAGPAHAYFDCLDREIETVAAQGYRFDEVYVGGGTPTVLPDRLLDTITRLRQAHPVRDVSVETNPNELTRADHERLAAAGVSRLSIGVQSFDDSLLREMHRYEPYGSGDDVCRHIEELRGVYDTVNVDMIFNLPHQDEAALAADLDILTRRLAADQVSFYPLMAAGDARVAVEQTMGRVGHKRERRYYEQIAGRFADAGYTRNSAWCFSRGTGMVDEYIVQREEYVGLGSGAFSFLRGAMYASTFSNRQYAKHVAAGGTGTVLERHMGNREQMRYYLLMQLFGGDLDIAAAEQRFGGRFEKHLWPEISALRLIGAVQAEDGRLRLTERGFYLWVVLMREFFTGINRLRQNLRQQQAPGLRAAHAGE